MDTITGAEEWKVDSHQSHSGHIKSLNDIPWLETSRQEHRGDARAVPVLAILRLSVLEVVLHAPPEEVQKIVLQLRNHLHEVQCMCCDFAQESLLCIS